MKDIYEDDFHNLPEDVQKHLMDITGRIKTAKIQIEDMNFGLAKENLEYALERLVKDNGEELYWLVGL